MTFFLEKGHIQTNRLKLFSMVSIVDELVIGNTNNEAKYTSEKNRFDTLNSSKS